MPETRSDSFQMSWVMERRFDPARMPAPLTHGLLEFEPCGRIEVNCAADERHRLPDLLRALAKELERQFAERGEGLK